MKAKNLWLLPMSVFVVVPMVVAQAPVPAPPRPAGTTQKHPPPKLEDRGPSLQATLNFIADKLDAIEYQEHISGGTAAGVWTTTVKFTNVQADEASCRLSYHMRISQPPHGLKEEDFIISLRAAEDVVTEPLAEVFAQDREQFQAPDLGEVLTITPNVTLVIVRSAHNKRFRLFFLESDIADRVAKAFIHSIELCGGGNEPF